MNNFPSFHLNFIFSQPVNWAQWSVDVRRWGKLTFKASKVNSVLQEDLLEGHILFGLEFWPSSLKTSWRQRKIIVWVHILWGFTLEGIRVVFGILCVGGSLLRPLVLFCVLIWFWLIFAFFRWILYLFMCYLFPIFIVL